MVFNKTKRKIEKTSSIISIIASSLRILASLVLIALAIYVLTNVTYLGTHTETSQSLYYNWYYGQWIPYEIETVVDDYGINVLLGTILLVPGLLIFALSIPTLILATKLVKSPIGADGSFENRKGKRVAMLVLTILCGGVAELILWIITLSKKDFLDSTENQNLKFNESKRATEKAAAIVSIVFNSLLILVSLIELYDLVLYYIRYNYFGSLDVNLSFAIFAVLLALGIVEVVLSATLIKSPVRADGTIAKRTGKRVTLLVFSLFTGLWVCSILWIIVLCFRDYIPDGKEQTTPIEEALEQPNTYTTEEGTPTPDGTELAPEQEEVKPAKEETKSAPVQEDVKPTIVKEDAKPAPAQTPVSAATQRVKEGSLEAKIAKLKEFKESGLITEATYARAVEKLISDYAGIK